MGGTRSSSVDWGSTASTYKGSTMASAYGASSARGGVDPKYDPKNIKVRESRASVVNPHPTPIIIAFDCTGSMQDLAVSGVENIGFLMKEIYDRNPVSDPHVMAMFFDDVFVSPNAALQATQFEADQVIIDQLKDMYFVGNGGGNSSESTTLPWHFALNKCECDAFDEGRKGFLFTLGDDGVPPPLTTEQLRAVYGPDEPEVLEPVSTADMLLQLEENWHVYNLVPTGRGGSLGDRAVKPWRTVLGERCIELTDITKLAEVLVAVMQVVGGADKAAVVDSFADPGTALVVKEAVKGLVPSGSSGGGAVRL